jgi:lon-related putative ATP-dependent protease
MPEEYKLDPSELKCLCDPKQFAFKNTSQIEPLDTVIGQKRAVSAIEFGLNMKSPGYNIFVTGLEGTGKSTIVKELVQEYARTQAGSNDWCMVNNFKDEFIPKAIAVPRGKAGIFCKRMFRLVEDLKKELPKAFADETHVENQNGIQKKYAERQRDLFLGLEKFAQERKVMITRTNAGFQTVPLKDEKPIPAEDFRKLPEAEQQEIQENIQTVQEQIETIVREVNRIGMDMGAEIEALMEKVTLFVVKGRMDVVRADYREWPDVLSYLDEVREDIVENVEHFITVPKTNHEAADTMMFPPQKSFFQRYQVNVLVDRMKVVGAPVVFESNPTYHNVFGQIEKRTYMGTITTDFTMVQAGSLLKANGGYLIMEVEAVLLNPFVWDALKRALQNKLLFIEDVAVGLGYGTASLRPKPIPLEVKVILYGGYFPFQLLQNNDDKFNKIFKVRADFDDEVEKNPQTIEQYVQFIAKACIEENLLPLTPSGVSAVVEFGERYTAKKNKLSIRFGPIMSLLKEADYWARKARARQVSDKHVVKAFNESRFRYNLYEEKMHESYAENTLMIDVDGAVVGQVNALAVYQVGDIYFGRPSRITAETYMGKSGIINVEREAKLSGNTHDKGVLIISGYLGRTFAQNYPLSLSISVAFEQSYSGVDGDSASSTELYAILSSLSGIPIRQGVAVTGSVNQKGEVQAIGGVNEKIEGFFEVCKTKGLTGRQGVIIPGSNVLNLMLKNEVVDAVKKGKFHIYRVSDIAQGIEILTGVPAGKADSDGNYPPDSVYGKVKTKLETYMKRSMELNKKFE